LLYRIVLIDLGANLDWKIFKSVYRILSYRATGENYGALGTHSVGQEGALHCEFSLFSLLDNAYKSYVDQEEASTYIFVGKQHQQSFLLLSYGIIKIYFVFVPNSWHRAPKTLELS
jgi:hypothetical protein